MNEQPAGSSDARIRPEGALFRFSPRPNRAGEIGWREWGPEAFSLAHSEDKPVLLNLTAVWCHWCHVMDETTYSDPGIIQVINDEFIAVRVDADQNPHIQERYLSGGWPTNAFLTPEGDVLLSGTYIPPDEMKRNIDAVLRVWREGRTALDQRLADIRAERERATELASELRGEIPMDAYQTVLGEVHGAFDEGYGGFGRQPKFPSFDAMELLFHARRVNGDFRSGEMAMKTLTAMRKGEIHDDVEGGFFRYATRRDWSEPHYEKMLEGNAGMLENLTQAWHLTGAEWLKETARRLVEYVTSTLSSPEGQAFFGSQDADEDYYKRDRSGRQSTKAPPVDDTVHSDWNGKMCRALIEAGIGFAESAWVDRACHGLTWLSANAISENGGVHHFFRHGKKGGPIGVLADQAELGWAFLSAFEATGDRKFLSTAKHLAAFITDALEDPEKGAFFDVPEQSEATGALARREKPLFANVTAARFLWRLSVHLTDDWYAREAARSLEWFAGTFHAWGHHSAGYGLAAAEVLGQPTRVAVVGKPTPGRLSLIRTAWGSGWPNARVHPLNPDEELEWGVQEFPPTPEPAAYICVGTQCRGPVKTPDEMGNLLGDTPKH